MNASKIAELLAAQADDVARELLPNGKKESGEWCVGSIEGESGKSLKVCVSGSKAGIWSDFATGESGDLLDLWREVRGVSMVEAINQTKNYLGVAEPGFYRQQQKKPSYDKPAKPKCSASASELEWLVSRGITQETLSRFKVAGSGGKVYFPFMRGNEAVMVKWRSISSKDTAPTSKNQEPILFGWQALPEGAREVTICEGEIDAMSLYQLGFPALSVPFGGGKGGKQNWIENEFENLERFDKIYVCMDSDAVGREAAKEIIERLGRHRCVMVSLPAKDANDCIQQGVPFAMIQNCFANAVSLDPSELRKASTFYDEVHYEIYPEERPIQEDTLCLLGNSFPENFVFRPDEMIAITGTNGHGKSEWLGNLVVEGAYQGLKWCIASMELKPGRLLGRMAMQAGGMTRPSKQYLDAIIDWFDDRLWIFDAVGSVKTSRILEVFEYAYKRYGIKHFVIDSLMMCGIADDDYAGQKEFLLKIRDFKSQFNVTVFVVMHPRKLESEKIIPGKFDVLGGIAITNLLDSGISIWRNKHKEKILSGEEDTEKSDEEIEDMPDCKAQVWKQRNGDGWEGTAKYYFNKESRQYRISPKSKPFHYVKFSATEEKRA